MANGRQKGRLRRAVNWGASAAVTTLSWNTVKGTYASLMASMSVPERNVFQKVWGSLAGVKPPTTFEHAMRILATIRGYLAQLGDPLVLQKYWGISSVAVSNAFGFLATLAPVVYIALGLLFTGVSLRTAWKWYTRGKRVVTLQRRDKGGALVLGDSEFPFPRYLHQALRVGPVSEKDIDGWIPKKHKYDALLFKFMYVPIDDREEKFGGRLRMYTDELKKQGHETPSTIGTIKRRVSEFDVLYRPDIVAEAAAFSGVGYDAAWGAKYMKLKAVSRL